METSESAEVIKPRKYTCGVCNRWYIQSEQTFLLNNYTCCPYCGCHLEQKLES